jgi:hypothetical protein
MRTQVRELGSAILVESKSTLVVMVHCFHGLVQQTMLDNATRKKESAKKPRTGLVTCRALDMSRSFKDDE